jgi:hypothetical protein
MSTSRALCIFVLFIVSLTPLDGVAQAESMEENSTQERDLMLEELAAMLEEIHMEVPRPPASDETIALMHRIRRDKFDQILPQIMRERKIDMWIHVVREGDFDPMGYLLGSNEGVFIFTDRGGDRIERAVIGNSSTFVDESGAYDIIIRPEVEVPLTAFPGARMFLVDFYLSGQAEWPGGPKTELDFRFPGVGEFVAERDPKRIAVNYLEELGSAVLYEIPRLRPDGISHTDFNLLTRAIGEKYTGRIVSAEYLEVDFMARPVASEIELYTMIRAELDVRIAAVLDRIEPGVTRVEDLDFEVSAIDSNGRPRGGEDVIQRGDFMHLVDGHQSGGFMMRDAWKYGNYHECLDSYAYVLREGEAEPPPHIQRAWNDALAVRKIIEDNVKIGRTAGDNFEILKQKIDEAGFIYIDRQDIVRTPHPDKTWVPIDLHAAGAGIYAPRIGPLGPDWQREIELPMYHHFYLEYWVDVAMPEWGEGESLNMRFHDGAMVTDKGVEYFFPPPTELALIQ